MPLFSIDDLITPLTREQVQASIYRVLGIIGVNTTSWKPGAVVRTQIVASSIVLAALSKLQASIARSGFLEFSEGDWLKLVAIYVYGVTPIDASFASGFVTLTNTGGGVYSLDADDLVFINTRTGLTYRNSGSVTLGALTTITIPILATEAGSASTANAGEITQMSTPLLGVTCTNTLGLTGLDAESDPALRERCYEQLGALSPMGPWDAYGSALRNAKRADGSSLGITRTRINKDGFGGVFVYCANASGPVPGTVGDLTSDLGIADEAIQQWAAPLAVTAHTISATAVPIAVTYEVWMYNTSGRTPTEVEQLISDRLSLPTGFFPTQPLGGNVIGGSPGKVFVDAIRAAIASVLPQIFHVVVTLPASDTTLAVSEVPTAGTITSLGVHQSAPPEGFSP
jgi:uncharacterized phage protein gp47/JayE